jgi:hypothetical protein
MEVQTAGKSYLRIRKEKLNSLGNDTVRAIVGSQFSATPNFEDKYYEYIKENKKYFETYSRWILSQSSLPYLPEDNQLYTMIDDILGVSGGKNTIEINYPLLYFFLDMFFPFIDRIIDAAFLYYVSDEDKCGGKGLAIAITNAMIRALMICRKEDVERESYSCFLTAFIDAFKIFFASEIRSEQTIFPSDDKLFADAIENEWRLLYPYSDFLYGFEVVPKFSPDDMFRYLRLPFSNNDLRGLSKKKEYQQIMNYVAAIATFKPVPDSQVRAYFQQEMCKLFTPLVLRHVRIVAKKLKIPLDSRDANKLQGHLNSKLAELTVDFDYFYASTKNLEKKKVSPFDNLFLPLRGRLARLGHIFDSNEYPFTDYVSKKLIKETDIYFFNDKPTSDKVSLDSLINVNDEGDTITLADCISDNQELRETHLLNYDAIDKNGELIGWKMETFCGITGKGKSTLKRWEKQGLIKPKRYDIYSRKFRGIVSYRAYSREDLEYVKEISAQMLKNMSHKQ